MKATTAQGIRVVIFAALLCPGIPRSAVADSEWFLSQPITNPTPEIDDQFGYAVAGVGTDKVLIGACFDNTGATNAGAAYLYDLNGTLLTTYTNPTPEDEDFFSIGVAAVGTDRVLIGARGDDTGAYQAGAAYLFSTNGTLLTTYTNPAPADFDYFGYAVAGVGTDKVLIGAPRDGADIAGAAYLYSTNGTLLTTYNNPTPEGDDRFGAVMAGVGTDKVLIAAYGDDTGATDAGSAYLYSTDGALLFTYTNPTPESIYVFGHGVSEVGTNKVLIMALSRATSTTNAGSTYLYSTDGTLLTIYTNPAPESSGSFGAAVSAVGNDKVLFGVPRGDTGATNLGAAYLYDLNGVLLTTYTNPNTNPTQVGDDRFGAVVAGVGSNKVLIGAKANDTGATDAGTAYLYELLPPDAPVIEYQPYSQLGFWGKSVSFDVLAIGFEPFTYQWRHNGIPMPDATNAILTLNNLQFSDGGGYDVIVSNAYGTEFSDTAFLTINPSGVSIDLHAAVTIDGVPGLTYGIQSTSDLSNTNSWVGEANITLSLPVQRWFDLEPATHPRKYYRVVPGPVPIL